MRESVTKCHEALEARNKTKCSKLAAALQLFLEIAT